VSHDSDQANAQVRQLSDKLAKDDEFLRLSSEYALEQRLSGVPVAVVAEKGVDGSTARAALAVLQKAGAVVPGILWLNDSWGLDSAKQLADLQSAVTVSGNNATARVAALRLLARRLAEPPPGATRGAADTLQALRDAGFIDFTDGNKNSLARFPPRAARVLVLTSTNSALTPTSTLIDLVTALNQADVPVVVGEIYDDHGGTTPVPQRGVTLAPITGDATLRRLVSTVDDAELLAGQVSAAIALEQIVGGTVDHYGFGQGADKLFPPRSP
jgi:hypothetical protein